MGWTGDVWQTPRGKEELKNYFERRLHSSNHENKIIDYSIKGNVFFAAVDTDGVEVWGLVVYFGYKTTRSKGRTETEFLYKMEDETEGPCARNCPKRIIRKLTPTDREYAISWRRACLGLPPVNPDQLELFA